jgi:hypothetical protein
MRTSLFRGCALALIASAVALLATSPTQVRYWVVLGIVIWAVAPWLGATTLPALVIRHGALFLAVIVGIPFAVSGPQHRTFWVLLAALLFASSIRRRHGLVLRRDPALAAGAEDTRTASDDNLIGRGQYTAVPGTHDSPEGLHRQTCAK